MSVIITGPRNILHFLTRSWVLLENYFSEFETIDQNPFSVSFLHFENNNGRIYKLLIVEYLECDIYCVNSFKEKGKNRWMCVIQFFALIFYIYKSFVLFKTMKCYISFSVEYPKADVVVNIFLTTSLSLQRVLYKSFKNVN